MKIAPIFLRKTIDTIKQADILSYRKSSHAKKRGISLRVGELPLFIFVC